MKITFKNVGQGDSLLLEWQNEGESSPRVGIIDCKKDEKQNPILEHVKKMGIKKIDFIALSHPHYDHYSGMLELLEYCEDQAISIDIFINSAGEHEDYIKWFVIDDEEMNVLQSIFLKSIQLYNDKLITIIGRPTLGWRYKINNDFSLICISPSDEEVRLYNKKVNLFGANDEKKTSQAANILATIFMIQSSNSHYAILTSDATIETFDRIMERNMDMFDNSKLLLSQIPHHGSRENHQIEFWKLLKYSTNSPSIVSAGNHGTYNHPHKTVMEDFDGNNFKIYSTNFINGIEEMMNERTKYLSRKLNMISKITERSHLEGDQTFKLTPNSARYMSIT